MKHLLARIVSWMRGPAPSREKKTGPYPRLVDTLGTRDDPKLGRRRKLGQIPDSEHTCPRCASRKVAQIAYGLSYGDPTLQDDVAAGRQVLGGCLVSDSDPEFFCHACGHTWGTVLDRSPDSEHTCPACGSRKVYEDYDSDSEEIVAYSNKYGRMVSGTLSFNVGDPRYWCRRCGHEWGNAQTQ